MGMGKQKTRRTYPQHTDPALRDASIRCNKIQLLIMLIVNVQEVNRVRTWPKMMVKQRSRGYLACSVSGSELMILANDFASYFCLMGDELCDTRAHFTSLISFTRMYASFTLRFWVAHMIRARSCVNQNFRGKAFVSRTLSISMGSCTKTIPFVCTSKLSFW